jgi:predicted RNA-binding Zn ribbon-like protein
VVTTLHTRLDLVRDYVNTFDLETGIDTIATPDELATWLSEQGLVDDLVEPTEQEVEDARAVREAIRELLLANNGVESDPGAASQTLEEAGRKARLGVRFEEGRPVLAPEDDGARGAIGRIVATVAELAPSDEW